MLKILDKEIHRGDKFIVDCALSDNDGRTALLPYYVIAGHADGPVPVSYTHLDVYKRQM